MTTITELESLLAAGTPGPWQTYEAGTLNTRVFSTDPTVRNVTVCRHPCASINAKNDALLIAALRNAAPDLIAAVKLLAQIADPEKASAFHSCIEIEPFVKGEIDGIKWMAEARAVMKKLSNTPY